MSTIIQSPEQDDSISLSLRKEEQFIKLCYSFGKAYSDSKMEYTEYVKLLKETVLK